MATPRTIYLRASSYGSITQGLRMFAGEDLLLNVQMTPPVDITGWAISMGVYSQYSGGTSLGTISAAMIVDGPRGIFTFSIPGSLTASATVGRWVFDARRTDSGSKMTVMDGWIDLRAALQP